MNKKIKNAFDSIHAEEKLINNTIEYINKKRGHQKTFAQRLIPIAASFILVASISLFGYKVYNTSTVVLSVDINPSFEIGVNRFDKVISIQEFNNDGEEFIENIDIKNMNYKEALNTILENKEFANSDISVTVAGKEGKQKKNISIDIESISKEKQNLYCDSATNEEVSEAHTKGLSFGKYKAYLKLIEKGYEITEDEIKDMPMKDIRDKLKKDNENEKDHSDKENDKGHNGKHNSAEEESKPESEKGNGENDGGKGNGHMNSEKK